ncbi:MAG: ABC transporter ATP-binding protein, partial [Armatimonadota bacterium]
MDRGEKVALVGRNGTGKSTLLRIISGQYPPDEGSVNVARGVKVGYLKQEAPVNLGRTLLEEAESGAAERLELQRRIEAFEAKGEIGLTGEELEEFGSLHERFVEMQGYSADRDVTHVLRRMGFTEDEFAKPTSSLSGGERTRLAIARLLLEEPDLLILDEPTNHLDLQATQWLESWVRDYPGAVLLVSHDRTFLDNTADRVLLLKDGAIKAYPGPFEHYLRLKAEDDARQTEVARRQQMEIDRLDEFVRRFMNSQRTAQARGRLKMKERLEASKVNAPRAEKGLAGGFSSGKRSGEVVLEAKKLRVGFDDGEVLIGSLDWTVTAGDRWGIVGANGAGKSTLVKTALGQRPAHGGQVKLGSNVDVGYFSQDAEDLDPTASPLDVLVYEDGMLPEPARKLLGRFLLSGDDVFRPIRSLSGGEKNKLSLARLTHQKPNLLVLDEPTNHLDMDSRDALIEILREYDGTLLLVSHDRHLLNAITRQTLDVQLDGVVQYPGSYAEYASRRRAPMAASVAVPVQAPASAPTPPTAPVPEPVAVVELVPAKLPTVKASPPTNLSPREVSKEIDRHVRLIKDRELRIAKLETEIKVVEDLLSSPSGKD